MEVEGLPHMESSKKTGGHPNVCPHQIYFKPKRSLNERRRARNTVGRQSPEGVPCKLGGHRGGHRSEEKQGPRDTNAGGDREKDWQWGAVAWPAALRRDGHLEQQGRHMEWHRKAQRGLLRSAFSGFLRMSVSSKRETASLPGLSPDTSSNKHKGDFCKTSDPVLFPRHLANYGTHFHVTKCIELPPAAEEKKKTNEEKMRRQWPSTET